MSAETYDAIVVGSGAGGGFAAMALSEAGLRVLLIERGARFEPADFPTRLPDWELRANAFGRAGTNAVLVPGQSVTLDPADRDLWSRSGPEPPAAGDSRLRRPLFYHGVYGVGGATLHYQGEAHRFADHAFRSASEYGHGVDWPIGYRDLEPWYDRAERILGVAGDPDNPHKPPRGPYPTPAHRLSTANQYAAAAAATLGWHLRPNALALPSREHDGRPGCQRSGTCFQGCPFGAKSSTDLSAVARGLRTGRLTLLDNARVLQVETGRDGDVTAVVYRRDGVDERVHARVYVLALGAFETPRLLLASANGRHPAGIGNDADQVGRHLMITLLGSVYARVDEPLHSYRGPAMGARIWDMARPVPGDTVRSGFVLGVSGTSHSRMGPVAYALRIPGIGLAHKRAMREQFGGLLNLYGVIEQEPQASNRLRLATDAPDSDGVPRLEVDLAFSEADRAALRRVLRSCLDWAEACEADAIENVRSSVDNPYASHAGGTCRMGADPEHSVVDRFGRVHGTRNLYISDASVLPTQGAGDSPSLTIQALALRTAAHIAA